MLTGCMYEEFTINSEQQDRDKIIREINAPQKLEVSTIVRNALSEYTPTGRVAYDTLSEQMLSRLLDIAKDDGEVNALVSVDVYYPPRSETSYSNDERKVVVWDFPDMSKFMKKDWANPNSLNCEY